MSEIWAPAFGGNNTTGSESQISIKTMFLSPPKDRRKEYRETLKTEMKGLQIVPLDAK